MYINKRDFKISLKFKTVKCNILRADGETYILLWSDLYQVSNASRASLLQIFLMVIFLMGIFLIWQPSYKGISYIKRTLIRRKVYFNKHQFSGTG